MREFIGEIMILTACSGKENANCYIGNSKLANILQQKVIMDRQPPDFIATLKYYTAEEGGRRTPAKSGYRPQIKFDFEEMQTSGQQTFIDKEIVYPGDTVKAEIKMLSPMIFNTRLSNGMTFQFREGARVIGIGQIIEILNRELNILPKD
jgi:translation elongation factor EF-Tu-like GTPase